MDQNQFLISLDELFELDEGTVRADNVLQDIEGWSSLTFMGLIAMVDEECGVTLSPQAVLSSVTVADLWTTIQQEQSSAAA